MGGSDPKPSTQTTGSSMFLCVKLVEHFPHLFTRHFNKPESLALIFEKNSSGLAPRCGLVWEFPGGLRCGLELGFLAFTISIWMLTPPSSIATWTAPFNEMVEVPTVRFCRLLRDLDPCCGAHHWQSKSLQRILDWCLPAKTTLVYWPCRPFLFPAQNKIIGRLTPVLMAHFATAIS